MRVKKNYLVPTLLITIVSMTSCGSESTSVGEVTSVNRDLGYFEIKVDGELKFGSSSNGAKVHLAKPYLLGLKATDWHVRISGNKLPDNGPGKTDDLGFNNVMFSTTVKINGQSQRVGCKPAKNPIGYFNRTKLTDSVISGEFSVEFVTCSDYMTAKSVDYPDKPFTVSGKFTDIKLK